MDVKFLEELGEEAIHMYDDVIEKETIKGGAKAKDNYVKDGKEVARTVISSKTRKQIKKAPKKIGSK
ncbi:hypothetical protein [Clostridium sp.]|uniref:hypothetical protein n=1 Tax=Clostridium sp. TaxID=1506 RepID=UPI00257CD330|nr:hypothetical protein [Clostridium sp.]MBS4840171.1 hypothetical protein [Clostridium sp.]MDU1401072.1 hypothetical protein [Clostridium sp.]MDU4924722.1 hypothetical protein [Clostridium sp.]